MAVLPVETKWGGFLGEECKHGVWEGKGESGKE